MAQSITVQLDPEYPDLTHTLEASPGSTVRWVKEEICRQDPTGATKPQDLRLCDVCNPGTTLADDTDLAGLGTLVLHTNDDEDPPIGEEIKKLDERKLEANANANVQDEADPESGAEGKHDEKISSVEELLAQLDKWDEEELEGKADAEVQKEEPDQGELELKAHAEVKEEVDPESGVQGKADEEFLGVDDLLKQLDGEQEAWKAAEPLLGAIWEGNAEEVASLVAGDAGLEVTEFQDGRSPLNAALELLGTQSRVSPSTVLNIVRILLDSGADPKMQAMPNKQTPLQLAVSFGSISVDEVADAAVGLDLIRALLDAKADPNFYDDFGETPLFEVACSGNVEICQMLLSYGASPSFRNVNGNCAIDLATEEDVRAVLEAAMQQGGVQREPGEMEFRQAADGSYYTRDQFIEFYGGLEEWDSAPKKPRADVPTASAPQEGVSLQDALFDLDELEENEEKFSDLRRQMANSPGNSRSRSQQSSAGRQSAAAPSKVASNVPRGLSVQKLREQGNDHFRAGRYDQAKRLYSEGLRSEPSNPFLLSNRAAASLMLKEWEEAGTDAFQAVRLDPNNPSTCVRCAKCLLLTNRLDEAFQFCQQRGRSLSPVERQSPEWAPFIEMTQRLPHHNSLLNQMEHILADRRQAESEGPAGSIVHGVQEMQSLLNEGELVSPFGERLGFAKVRALLFPIPGISGQSEETRKQWTNTALAEMDRLLQEKYRWPDSHHWRARCLIRLGRRKDAREALKEAMHIAKELGGKHLITEQLLDIMEITETQKEQGNIAFQRRDWPAALAAYDAAVKADEDHWDVEFSAQIFCNRSNVRSKMGKTQLAIDDASAAIALTPNYSKALFRRGILLMELEKYKDALSDFQLVARLTPNFAGLSEWLSRARKYMSQPPAKKYYRLLGISFDATPAEVKKAYKVAALRWHPDKNRDKAAEAERMFKDILEAFEVLSDPRKRAEYDGMDEQGTANPGSNFGAGGYPSQTGGFGGFGRGHPFQSAGNPFHHRPGRPFNPGHPFGGAGPGQPFQGPGTYGTRGRTRPWWAN